MSNTTDRRGFSHAPPATAAEAMAAFDALPKALRNALNYYPLNVDPNVLDIANGNLRRALRMLEAHRPTGSFIGYTHDTQDWPT